LTYDPAFAFEIAVIIREGIYRMYELQHPIFYYLSVGNENYAMPPMPEGSKEGILKGMYRFRMSPLKDRTLRAHLLGNGSIMHQVLKAQEALQENYGVAADVWSVTSFNQIRREALNVERWNMLHPLEKPQVPYLTNLFSKEDGVIIAASDYLKILPDGISKWLPGKRILSLGTDGFGRSDSRAALRDFFEIDWRHIVLATVSELYHNGQIPSDVVRQVLKDLEISPQKKNPMRS
jgi:pyruvate dehydrogenase E1 component